MDAIYRCRGFLPAADPLSEFPAGSPFALLDEIGRALPERLTDPGFRAWCGRLVIPRWDRPPTPETLPELRHVDDMRRYMPRPPRLLPSPPRARPCAPTTSCCAARAA